MSVSSPYRLNVNEQAEKLAQFMARADDMHALGRWDLGQQLVDRRVHPEYNRNQPDTDDPVKRVASEPLEVAVDVQRTRGRLRVHAVADPRGEHRVLDDACAVQRSAVRAVEIPHALVLLPLQRPPFHRVSDKK